MHACENVFGWCQTPHRGRGQSFPLLTVNIHCDTVIVHSCLQSLSSCSKNGPRGSKEELKSDHLLVKQINSFSEAVLLIKALNNLFICIYIIFFLDKHSQLMSGDFLLSVPPEPAPPASPPSHQCHLSAPWRHVLMSVLPPLASPNSRLVPPSAPPAELHRCLLPLFYRSPCPRLLPDRPGGHIQLPLSGCREPSPYPRFLLTYPVHTGTE